jgi:superfamily II DNA or RNA helicase
MWALIAFKGRLVQCVGRVLRPYAGKAVAEVHDYHDVGTGVLASSQAKRRLVDNSGLPARQRRCAWARSTA